jgi:hypothetical protein
MKTEFSFNAVDAFITDYSILSLNADIGTTGYSITAEVDKNLDLTDKFYLSIYRVGKDDSEEYDFSTFKEVIEFFRLVGIEFSDNTGFKIFNKFFA